MKYFLLTSFSILLTVLMYAQTFTEQIVTESLNQPYSMRISDYDKDGDDDYLVMCRNNFDTLQTIVFYENQEGLFKAHELFSTEMQLNDFVVFDDSEAFGDLLVTVYEPDTSVQFNAKLTVFMLQDVNDNPSLVSITDSIYPLGSLLYKAYVSGGVPEFLLFSSTGQLLRLKYDGNIYSTQHINENHSLYDFYALFDIEDGNLDGSDEIYFWTQEKHLFQVIFTADSFELNLLTDSLPYPYSIDDMSWADVNNDGQSDMIWVNGLSLNVSLRNGNSFDPSFTIDSISSAPDKILVEDINNDGSVDLMLVENYELGAGNEYDAHIYLGNGDATFNHKPVNKIISGEFFAFGDFDGGTNKELALIDVKYFYLSSLDDGSIYHVNINEDFTKFTNRFLHYASGNDLEITAGSIITNSLVDVIYAEHNSETITNIISKDEFFISDTSRAPGILFPQFGFANWDNDDTEELIIGNYLSINEDSNNYILFDYFSQESDFEYEVLIPKYYPSPSSMHTMVDMDNDGDKDMVNIDPAAQFVIGEGNYELLVYERANNELIVHHVDTLFTNIRFRPLVYDFNKDGLKDIFLISAFAQNPTEMGIYYQNASWNFNYVSVLIDSTHDLLSGSVIAGQQRPEFDFFTLYDWNEDSLIDLIFITKPSGNQSNFSDDTLYVINDLLGAQNYTNITNELSYKAQIISVHSLDMNLNGVNDLVLFTVGEDLMDHVEVFHDQTNFTNEVLWSFEQSPYRRFQKDIRDIDLDGDIDVVYTLEGTKIGLLINDAAVAPPGSIEDLNKESQSAVQVFPNPSKGYVNLTSKGAHIKSVNIYNAAMQLVTSLSNVNNDMIQLDMSKMDLGTYFIEIKDVENNKFYNCLVME